VAIFNQWVLLSPTSWPW